jgi:polyisoprenoid-binding protein YceI
VSGVAQPSFQANEIAMSIERTRRVVACLGVLAGVAFAAMAARGQSFRIDPEHSTAGFAVNHFGVLREHGRFKRAAGTIVVDPDGLAGGSIGVVIDLASVDTGWDLRDDFLRGPTMFDVIRYPQIRFRSRHLEYRDHNVVAADGDITLHGVTRPLRLEVHRLACGHKAGDGPDGCEAVVTGRLLRRDFGISFAYPLVGDEVELNFEIAAVRIGNDIEAHVQ